MEDQESNKEEEGADRAAAEQIVGGKSQVIVWHHWEIDTKGIHFRVPVLRSITVLGQKVVETLTTLNLRFSDSPFIDTE